ncbi:glutamyl-tRNA synthetase [Flavobacterium sp. ACAM 123]|uniref:glutamyl-tRNA synthetase n=1 Tax=Flavobacterium sp. ACAM 123 TaxID=1189620 RepID=UPI0002D864C3|nr:glutamyl-tRNA synthetase [Flavobacterium sp. ACAM 123]
MESSNGIYQKLEAFIRKYYTNELIRGTVLFIGLGLLYFLFTLFVEYFLWLKPMARAVLFWTFVGVEVFLLFRFILFPIFKLLKFQKGIDYNQASKIIGSHFVDVNDSLTNFLQLSDSGKEQHSSELLLASIDQKANALQPIPFGNAINFKSNSKYLPFAIVPILLILIFYVSGNNAVISQSLNRVVHFNDTFLPPAPFKFVVLNANLQTEENKDFMLKIKSEGSVVPENAMIHINGESYFMENSKPGEFQFKIAKPMTDVLFHVEGNAVASEEYHLKVVAVPTIDNFEMQLNYPSYLNRKSEVVKGTGNAVIPEGTKVTWKISAFATQDIYWSNETARFQFIKEADLFSLSKNIVQNTDYQVVTSNERIKDHEKLFYQLTVIKDQFPTISASYAPDSLKVDKSFVLGQVADDYGLSKLQIVYYPNSKPVLAKRRAIPIKKSGYGQFLFSFPGRLAVEQGVSYEYYFEVFDNDVRNGFKSSKTSVFSNRVVTDEEKKEELLQQQNDNINSLEKSLKNQDKQLSEIDKLQKTGKEKEQFEFKEQQNVRDFVERQKKQDEMMKEFSKKMKDNLEDLKTIPKDEAKEDLKNRLDKADEDLEKNQKLLDELKELNDKIKNEDLLNKLDQFKQKSKNQIRNLEQLVELTKKYYVEKKAEQFADKLDKLSVKQDKLAENEKENSAEKQKGINSDFEKIQKELKDLDKDNAELKSPVDIPSDPGVEKSIADDLKKASDELQKENKAKAKPNQKKAAGKMKAMAKKMEEGLEGSEKEQMEEDVKMLRQILDNLLAFSLSQEYVMMQFRDLKRGSPAFNKNIKLQQDLKLQFKHVDDSLFAMSLRNPKIAEDITKEIGNVHYNIDKSLVSLSDAQIPKGLSHQQYAVSSANKLGDFLSDILNNMQMSLSGMGSGKPKSGSGEGMQLPDIIKKQQGLGDKMKEGMEKGQKPGEGKDGKPGEGDKNGKNGSQDGVMGEGDAKVLLEIYKEQKQLREALENELRKQGLGGSGQNSLEQMKQIEKQLLNKGFKNETLQKILNVKQELLKLNSAVQQQGEEKKRQSESNRREFNNESKPLPDALLDYLNSIEILNRQSLPLRSNYNRKVQEYFNKK